MTRPILRKNRLRLGVNFYLDVSRQQSYDNFWQFLQLKNEMAAHAIRNLHILLSFSEKPTSFSVANFSTEIGLNQQLLSEKEFESITIGFLHLQILTVSLLLSICSFISSVLITLFKSNPSRFSKIFHFTCDDGATFILCS